MKKPIFIGSGVALVTPFKTDLSVDYDKLKELVLFHIENKTKALVILGTTAETATLTDDEYENIIKFVVDTNNNCLKIIVGCGSNNTAKAIRNGKICEKYNVDALLVVTPYYNLTTQEGLIQHFISIADNVKTPILLYNVPSRTGISITPCTYQVLSKHPNIVGVKEASSDITLPLRTKKLCGSDFYIYTGNDQMIFHNIAMGGSGVISVVANILPNETQMICEHFINNEVRKSLDLQLKYLDLIDLLFIETNPIPIKEALFLIGKIERNYRLPLIKMSEENSLKLSDEMKKIGLL